MEGVGGAVNGSLKLALIRTRVVLESVRCVSVCLCVCVSVCLCLCVSVSLCLCSLFSALCSLFSVLCSLFSVLCSLFSTFVIHCLLLVSLADSLSLFLPVSPSLPPFLPLSLHPPAVSFYLSFSDALTLSAQVPKVAGAAERDGVGSEYCSGASSWGRWQGTRRAVVVEW